MTAFVVPNFSGIAPRFADRLLDDSQASFCTNIKPVSGDLIGFRLLKPIQALSPTGTYRRVIKFYRTGTDEVAYFKSEDVNAHALQSPLAQDGFDRIYFTQAGSSGLRVITFDQLVSGGISEPSGVLRPTVEPTVTPPAGVTDLRAYVYAWQDRFGSIGPPSPPTIAQGDFGTWVIAGFQSPPTNAVRLLIYRSASGEATAGAYYQVANLLLPVSTYSDNMAPELVPLQPPLTSFDNEPPLDSLQGIVVHSSGAFAGYSGRTVYFSEPYLPSAWPSIYAYPVDDKIVGIAAIFNYIVVLTVGVPYILSGNHPANMGITKLPDIEPCTSHRSIVVMSNAVYFTSPNGLCKISQGGLERPTNQLMTRKEFGVYGPSTIIAASYGSYYIAFYGTSSGFSVALPPFEPISFVPLDRYAGITGLDTDSRTGELIMVQSDFISFFDAQMDARFPTTWRSKEYIAVKPINLGAFQLLFHALDVEDSSIERQVLIDAMEAYNATRFALGPLDTFNMYPFAGSLPPLPAPIPVLSGLPPIQPLGGEPLYDLTDVFGVENTRFTLIVDGQVKYTKVIADEKVHSLPEGYKATRFYFEVAGSAQLQRIVVAETRRECQLA